MAILLGAIADDFTGASDLANTLVKSGMRTVQTIGIPPDSLDLGDADAVVIALKSRSIPAAEAIEQSLDAYRWLADRATKQIFFKYCSTFDSTDEGNIGPVGDALLDAAGGDFTIYCPAFPENGRQIFNGYLFVGDVLLSESSMRNHPLTPMTDPNLVRVLARQTPNKVGLVNQLTVDKGAQAIEQAFDALQRDGTRHAIVDAGRDRDLIEIGHACKDLKLVTGGSGVAMGLPDNFRAAGLLAEDQVADALPTVTGAAAILSGSCSEATRGQVTYMEGRVPLWRIDADMAVDKGPALADDILDWAAPQMGDTPVMVSATAEPAEVKALQDRIGRNEAGELMEGILARVAAGLHAKGARRIVSAGGETSGAVVKALNVAALRIGPQIDPGVPWTASVEADPSALAMKSGNFGAPDFFEKAFKVLP